jgi:O-acetyl-ADP-ribose deacetylase (regulator of RNase III)
MTAAPPLLPQRIAVATGDITKLPVDAIVNAANESLLGGGGVDGAIHAAAGPELLRACRKLGGCPTGMAKITPGFQLPARWIIHAVGPVWSGAPDAVPGSRREDLLLASCYQTCLALAAEHEARSLAFPAISTGVYRFPKERAARIAVAQVRAFLAEHIWPQQVIFCCFTDADAALYQRVLGAHDAAETGTGKSPRAP